MFMPASSEFVTLCRAQMTLLSQILGAALSVVYLTEELVEGEQAKLIPVVAYPESDVVWPQHQEIGLLPVQSLTKAPIRGLLSASKSPEESPAQPAAESIEEFFPNGDDQTYRRDRFSHPASSRQLVLPLMHEEMVVGLLVTSRRDRPWQPREVNQISRIADTLALARILDQRGGWLENQLRQKQMIQSQQQDLLDNLLHQLRSPLTALRTFGKLLMKRLQGEDQNRQMAANILRESDRLQELLNQMDQIIDLKEPPLTHPLELVGESAKIQQNAKTSPGSSSGMLRLLPPSAIAACAVAEVLQPLFISAEAIAAEKDITCHLDLPENLPLVRANPPALREVLSNLIDNAVKYTAPGGDIYIQVNLVEPPNHSAKNQSQPSCPQIAIAISDTGPGIPEQDIDHLFERHYRGVQANGNIPGTGLGLAIVQDLLQEMHADIEVFSPAAPRWLPPNHLPSNHPGTTFVIWLPTAAPETKKTP